MSLKVIFLGLLIGLPAIASPKMQELNFRCVAQVPTTSFLLRTEGSEVVLTTVHHNGTAFMPIHEGIIVPHDLSYLAQKANVLQLMGDRNEYRFPIESCRVYGENLLSCVDGNTLQFGGRAFNGLHLFTSKVTEQVFDVKIESYKVTLMVNIEDFVPVQEIVMNYYGDECKFGF